MNDLAPLPIPTLVTGTRLIRCLSQITLADGGMGTRSDMIDVEKLPRLGEFGK
jgi:hypothetical protein